MIAISRISGSLFRIPALAVMALALVAGAWGESEIRANLEFYNTVTRGLDNQWRYVPNGIADIRIGSVGNRSMRAEAAVEFYPLDLSSDVALSAIPALNLKRLWIKANFPSWRLTVGKTKVAWGNGFVFNSGDVLFGSLSPYLDFTSSTIRDDTTWLTAVNIPFGPFTYAEAVLLPPSIEFDGSEIDIQTIDHTSGGLRFFTRLGGWRVEGGYLYKADQKVGTDLLGHRPYLSVHGHAGIDVYASASLAAGWDAQGDGVMRDTWDEISKTINFSFGAFHQLQTGYDSTLTLRLEGLLMPWQNWSAVPYADLLNSGGYYGLMLYPEITWMLASTWFVTAQSVISPVDASAQITSTFGWNVFQGFTLLGFVVVNAGEEDTLFAWDRSDYVVDAGLGGILPDYTTNGISFTLGARYTY